MVNPSLRTRIEHVDTDATGIVHFSRYTSLMETAGTEYLEEHGAGLTAFTATGIDVVLTDLRVRYLASAVHRDRIVGEARVAQAGAARLRLAVTLSREEPGGARTPLVSGELTFGAVDPATRHPVPLPPPIRAILKGLHADAQLHAAPGTGAHGATAGHLRDQPPGARTAPEAVHRPGPRPRTG
ncbi:thioesterase family protein [Lentzea sp. NPDC042327]|uniref:acyl-CoA thioesterase n=1 Tax=Lentzea sp. NPDC042327 TaxID=3154801 RepID=UPI00340B03A8